jgi:hypothetical protein
LLLFGMAFAACAPETPSVDGGRSASALEAPASPQGPVGEAEAVIGREFKGYGWIERIVQITFSDGVLRVTLDQPTRTMSELDAYTRMCYALTTLIGSEDIPSEIAAVHFFRKDGSPMVGSDAPNAQCSRF